MKIWLIKIGEPVPVADNFADRLYRTGQLAQFLSEKGHTVTWWTSTFHHVGKHHHFRQNTVLQKSPTLQIRMLYSSGYESNMSLARIKDQREVAAGFASEARLLPEKPDIIVCALPTIELCDEAVKFGREFGVPVVLDMRDMWPDILVDALPGLFRPIARLALKPMFDAAVRACGGCDAIIGITEDFVDWGLARGRRKRTHLDRAFPFANVATIPDDARLAAARDFWDSKGITENSGDFVVCFFGMIGHSLDVDTVVNAAKILHTSKPKVKFAVCGAGDKLEHYRNLSEGLGNILFPGWVDAAKIRVLMTRGSVGLDPMPDRYDFLATVNNKALEYMSAGLPVISSPKKGVLYRLLKENKCGLSHAQGDAQGLADIIKDLADNPEELRQLSANSKELFTKNYTLEKVCTDMMNYFEYIIEQRAQKSSAQQRL